MAPARGGDKHHIEARALRAALTSSARALASNGWREPMSAEVPDYRALLEARER
jgi:hypothetical protein